jgi:uncharacterized Ntn-hydrolase superfamily protein
MNIHMRPAKISIALATVLLAGAAISDVRAQAPDRTPDGAIPGCSIVARDPMTGDIGIAVSSGVPAVGAVVPWASANTGGIATQARANTAFGPEGLRMLGYGWSAGQTLDSLLLADPDRDSRQIGIVDNNGNSMAFTGPGCRPYAGHKSGAGYVVLGTFLSGASVLDSMASAFERTGGDLADRLLAALSVAGPARNDGRGGHSAALVVVRTGGGYGGQNDRFIDLRVDDHADPVGELRKIYLLWNSTVLIGRRLATIDQFNRDRQFAAAQEETRRVVESLNAQLKEHPDDPVVLDRVAWILATYDIARDRAIELSKRAVAIAPGDLGFRATLAECYFRLGMVDEAVRIASEIVAKEPGNEYYRGRLQKYLDAKAK